MRFNKFYLILLLLISFVACKPKSVFTESEITKEQQQELVNFKIIQLNDIYEISPISGGKQGGMARVAYIRDSISQVCPNTYMVLAGDFLSPSLLGTLKQDGKRIQGKQMVEVMNAMDFDLVTFGNHEFDLKEGDLLDRLKESRFPWTSSNILHKTKDGLKPFNMYVDNKEQAIPKTYTIKVPDADGNTINLGFFSTTIDSTPQDYVHYEDYMESAIAAYKKLKKTADVIVGLTHITIEDDVLLAEAMPKVPLIMGGHEHFNMLVPTKYGTVAKADANAKTVYVHTFQYNTRTKKVRVHSSLVPVNDKVGEQEKTKKVVDKWELVLEKELENIVDNPFDVIYQTKEVWDGTDDASRSEQTNLGAYITKAMYAAFDDLDAVVVNGGSIRIDDELEGYITSVDIFRILPFGGSIIKVDITGELLEESLNFTEAKSGTGAYLQKYKIARKDGEWHIDGKALDTEKIYKIAMTDFLITGYDIPFLTEKSSGLKSVYFPKEGELAYDVRKAIIEYLKAKKTQAVD